MKIIENIAEIAHQAAGTVCNSIKKLPTTNSTVLFGKVESQSILPMLSLRFEGFASFFQMKRGIAGDKGLNRGVAVQYSPEAGAIAGFGV